MARAAHALSVLALILLNPFSVLAELSDRSLHIDNGPAPPPDQGPPLSRNASRDMSLLPGQVCGIVGAYFFTIAVLGLCLFTFGRRMRRAAQTIQSADEVEMSKLRGKRVLQASPISPASSQRTWPAWGSPGRIRDSFRKSNTASPATVASFDKNVLENDKIQRQLEMERLYAAVMHQEEGRTSRVTVAEVQEEIELEPTGSRWQGLRVDTGGPSMLASRSPAYTLDPASPSSPTSPRSPVRAIYPPGSSLQRGANAATSPIYGEQPFTLQASAIRDNRTSFASVGSSDSRGRKLNLRIPSATDRYHTSEYGDKEAATPSTPQQYRHPDRIPSHMLQISETTPTGSNLIHSHKHFREDEIDEQMGISRQTLPRDFLRASSRSPPLSVLPTPVINVMASSSTLPLRALTSASPSWNNIQTTTLEPRRDLLSVSALRTGLATPYSPYMPFTPITPEEPRLVGRQERRIREREEGRRVVLDDGEGDWGRAKGDEELWGSGY